MCVAKTVYFKELTHMSVEALCIQNLTGEAGMLEILEGAVVRMWSSES
jgi:hypothetical protein